ncbi:VapB-type antitoxin [Candidatus Bathyarchaeota archaeon]|nr:VapB-type antitoxin [Candidatus Bathyarchaeota archaeon]
MSATISIRIPKELKKLLNELNIDWYNKVKNFIEELVNEELKNRVLKEADEIRFSIKRKTTSAAELIREDREHAH